MNNRIINIIFFSILILNVVHGQVDRNVRQKEREEVNFARPDTIPPGTVINTDSLGNNPITPKRPVPISRDAPDAEIVYGATDKKWFDLDSNLVHLYGNAFVEYGPINLKAGYIVFDFNNNIATAEGILDSAGTETQKPQFTEGETSFTYEKMRYNFKTQKGIVYNARTTEKDLFVLGAVTKFVSADADSTQEFDQIYNKNAIITSCDHDVPHYGIRTNKLKVVPDQLAIIGPSRLEIAGIPTPLVLPFGFFPLVQGKSSGLIFPDNYEYSQQWGFGLQNVGYYFALNDYVDMRITGDIYLRGSWGLRTETSYSKRYKFKGGLTLAYSSRLTEVPGQLEYAKNRSFAIRWNHNQDAKAHPYFKVGGSINMEFGGFTNLNNPSFQARSNSTRRSNLNVSHTLPGTPFSVSASMNHSQNINSGTVNMTFPNLQVRMQQIYPLKRKKIQGKPRWYENITLNYNSEAKNFVKSTDSTFFTNQTIKDLEYGVKHTASSNVSFKILKYINFNPGVNYNETWFFKKNQITLIDSLQVDSVLIDEGPGGEAIYRIDTLQDGFQQEELINAFTPYRDFNANASLSTTIFGTKLFSKGLLRGVRHVVKPSMSMNYQPVNRDRYVEYTDTDFREEFNVPEEYEILPNGVFGSPNLNGEGAFNLSYGIKNDLEAKYFSKKDSTLKNVRVFSNWRFSGNYNFNADSLKFSTVNFNTGNTSFFKGIVTLGFRMTLDPYQKTDSGRRINKFQYAENKVPLRMDNMAFTVNTRFTVKKIRELFEGESKKEDPEKSKLKKQETFLDLFNDFSINHTFKYAGKDEGDKTEFFVQTNTISLRGNIKLTDNWSIRVGNFGYDFKNKGFTYPDFGFARDLHCWNMNFSWQPRYGTYTFFIGVSSSSLNFIKANYNQNTADARTRR